MLSSVNQVKSEVLYERVFGIIRKYADYLNNTSEPLESIKVLYKEICRYPDKIILCDSDYEFGVLEPTIHAYEIFIETVSQTNQVVA